jgi:hypothetical protein
MRIGFKTSHRKGVTVTVTVTVTGYLLQQRILRENEQPILNRLSPSISAQAPQRGPERLHPHLQGVTVTVRKLTLHFTAYYDLEA